MTPDLWPEVLLGNSTLAKNEIPKGLEITGAYSQCCDLGFNKVQVTGGPYLVSSRVQTNRLVCSSKFGVILYLSVDLSLALKSSSME